MYFDKKRKIIIKPRNIHCVQLNWSKEIIEKLSIWCTSFTEGVSTTHFRSNTISVFSLWWFSNPIVPICWRPFPLPLVPKFLSNNNFQSDYFLIRWSHNYTLKKFSLVFYWVKITASSIQDQERSLIGIILLNIKHH